MAKQKIISAYNPDLNNFLRFIRSGYLPYEHNDTDFKKEFTHGNCIFFAYAVALVLLKYNVNHQVRVLLRNGSVPIHYYLSLHNKSIDKKVFIDASGIYEDEQSIFDQYGVDVTDENESSEIHFFYPKDNCENWCNIVEFVHKEQSHLTFSELKTQVNKVCDRFGALMIATLTSNSKRQKQLYTCLSIELELYKSWLSQQKWFQEMAPDMRCESESTSDDLLTALESQKPASEIWELAVDHWMTNDLDIDQGPESWQWIYAQIDEFRTANGITSTI